MISSKNKIVVLRKTLSDERARRMAEYDTQREADNCVLRYIAAGVPADELSTKAAKKSKPRYSR